MEILQQMLERAQANPQRIVLPEGDEPRTLEAANIILRDKIANLILLGSPAVINKMAEEKGLTLVFGKEAQGCAVFFCGQNCAGCKIKTYTYNIICTDTALLKNIGNCVI